ncbi:helix-turn-helix domain-containing protein [Streptomyces sp. ISL-43]|uniref:helix-turn-helix domain-containing protein n=1 Tax=Streptomyces sp. ISL-43 TaxID=2819183 RepID=UPI0027E4BC5E|nr:helix-turn-helix domain-containing protein [Streptomyces sp. ISL-43]
MIGNHLLQHPRLSATAIGVAAHIQSLPDGAPVGIKALAERFPEGEIRLGAALRELERHGYLERRRERLEGGRVVTRTYSYNKPGATSGGPPPSRTPAPSPPDGEVRVRDEPAPEPGERGPDPAVEAAPEPEPDPDPAPPSEAAALLAGLRRHDPRLLLSERDVARLAPGVSAWLARGVEPGGIERALSAGLPEPLRSAASVLEYRLGSLIPPPLPPVRVAVAAAVAGGAAGRRPDPLQNCDGCDRAFRAPEPGRCRTCPPAEESAAAA